MPPAAANETSLAKTAQGSGEDDLSRGLTSDEARARLAKFGPNACAGHHDAAVAHGAGQILGAGSMDA